MSPSFVASAGRVTARVTLPSRSAGAVHLEDADTGAGVDVALKDVKDVQGEIEDGFVIYSGAHLSGATVLHRPGLSGNEDFVSFESRPPALTVSYELTIGSKVAGLRLVANTLEMLDATGAPRLRVAPPYVVGADGARTDATLAVRGCAIDTDPSAPWGRPVTAPGAARCTVQVSWDDAAVVYPALLDPLWGTTGSMSTARQGHTATTLSTGKVLVVGGTSNGTTALASAELFDRTTGTWAATGSMTGARTLHAAVQLGTNSNATTSGKVLITGGLNGSTSQTTAQLYSVTAGTWVAAATLNAARHGHTATVLASGSVLVAGGLNGTTVLNTAATYNPGGSGNGTWTAVGNMASARRFHTATLLTSSNTNFNNKVLVVGGNSTGTTSLTSVQLFDGTSAWSTSTALPSAREGHTATPVSSGRLLITGGRSGSTTLNTALLFVPPASGTAATWTSTGNLTAARQSHAATLLATGSSSTAQVLVTGGSSGSASLASAETWNGTAWTATSPAMAAPVQGHTATLLANGAVLVAGGVNGSTTVASGQLFGVTCTANTDCGTGFCVSGVCCDTACNGGCGVCNLPGKIGTCSPATSGTTCRAAAGTCDVAETCNGTALTCPTDAFAAATTTCRAAAGTCDVAEKCTGTSAACPADGFVAAATVCRASAGTCDVAETCTGTSAACPTDTFAPATTTCRAAAGTCDAAEKCTGTSAACPADGFLAAATVCRAAAGVCDVAETCSGSSAACPADTLAGATTVCRPANGGCDVAETCTGTSTACPTDGFAAATTVCRASAGTCDVAETCTGSSAACPTDTFAPATTTCRAAAGTCDVAEKCTGSTAACPADALASSTTVCRAANGACDVAETCTGSSTACPADGFAPVTTVCRPANGACDVAESCTGTGTACPTDGFAPVTTVCRAAAGTCDVAETCTGTGAACPTDAFAPATTTCRAAAGTCDVAEKCTGAAAACPADGFLAATTVCRAAAGLCDVAETCTGTGAACPADALASATTVCRAANGACDVGETCTGTSTACPADALAPATTVCRPANGACDVAETCTGSSTACPTDGFAPATTVCRAANGVCDVAESCSGTSATCPTDGFASATTVCRASNGPCDVVEKCTGTTTVCPADGFAPATTVCRVASGGCDVGEACTGSSAACPNDAKAPDNSFCTDGNLCTVNDRCHGGVCVPGQNVTCGSDPCHATGTCDPATGFCANAGPINEGQACDDGNRCTTSSQCKLGVCVPEDPVTGCTGPSDTYYAPLTNLGSRQGISVASDINNHGVVAGTDVHYSGLHEFAPSAEGVGFSWTAESGIHLLPRPTGKQVSLWAISDDGEIVGDAWPQEVASPGTSVYHYDPATDQAQSSAAGWGMAINASGQYAGVGVFDAQGYKIFRARGTTFTPAALPSGFIGVNARAIDASGTIVGFLQRASGTLVSFRHTDALGYEYLTQLLPASADWDVDPVLGGDYLTSANGTNGIQIVGSAYAGNGKSRGFVLTPFPIGTPGTATIKKIDVPAGTTDDTAHTVIPYRINASGQVVGTIGDISNGPQRAFIWLDGVGTIDLNKYVDPNSGWTLQSALGINDGVNGKPEVVGDGLLNGNKRAFKMTVPDIRPCPAIDACHGPGVRDARTGVCSSPVLADGTTCDDASACTSGDHCQAGACVGTTTVACPGDACRPAGVCDPSSGLCSVPAPYPGTPSCDDGNRCTIGDFCNLGTCMPGPTDTGCRGPTDTYYVPVVDLGSTQGASYAIDINNAGEVIGSDTRGHYARAGVAGNLPTTGFRWTANGGIVQLPRPAGTFVFPHAMNATGAIAGETWDNIGGQRAFSFDSSIDTQLQLFAVLSGNGAAINDAGQVAGSGYFSELGGAMFRGTASSFQSFAGPPNVLATAANAIDPSGSLFGFTIRPDRTTAPVRYTDARGIEYLSQFFPPGGDWDLDPGVADFFVSGANGTNGTQIVGSAHTSLGFPRGFVLTVGADGTPGSGVVKQIPMMSTFPDDANLGVTPRDVNQAGEVVGAVNAAGIHDVHAFIWVDGTGIVDLNDLIDPASGWILAGAYAINDHREVVGYGWLNGSPDANGQQRAFKMTVPDLSPCPGADGCRAVGTRDLRTGQCAAPVLLSSIPSCQSGVTLYADGVVDIGGGRLVAVFGYENAAVGSVRPTTNQVLLDGVVVAASDPAPPVFFVPGSHRGSFLPAFGSNQTIVWSVDGQVVTASQASSHVAGPPDVSCLGKPDGTPCNDQNACTQLDQCSGQRCIGANPIACPPGDQCHLVSCDPATGICSNPPAPNGAACDDGNSCTQGDACQDGECVGVAGLACTTIKVEGVSFCPNARGTNTVAQRGWWRQ